MKKTVLVTGASSGIGESTVKMLIEKGHNVYAAARRVEKMKQLEQIGATLIRLDVSNASSISKAIEQINNESGGVDVLINNAGYGSLGSVEEVELDEARRQFEVNVFGMAKLIQLVTPNMREKGAGKIINISSVAGKINEPLGGWYHSTKFAVEGLSDCLRLELKSFGIDVIVVQPGPIKTEWGDIALDNLIKNSANGPYKKIAEGMSKSFNIFYNNKYISGPDAVAKIIIRAVEAKRPKTRYAAGRGASFILFSRKILSDKMFDKAMMAMHT